jgi:hypothetical protein
MVITAGLLDNEVWTDESQLAPRPGYDQKELTRQFTKIGWEARETRKPLPLMRRRAYKNAVTAPGGPVRHGGLAAGPRSQEPERANSLPGRALPHPVANPDPKPPRSIGAPNG